MLDTSGPLHRLDNDGATLGVAADLAAAAAAGRTRLLVALVAASGSPLRTPTLATCWCCSTASATSRSHSPNLRGKWRCHEQPRSRLRAPLPLPAGIEVGRAWFDSFEADGALIAPKSGGRRRAAASSKTCSRLRALVALLRSSGWAHERIFVLGFAQGGSAALAYALRSEHRLGGVASVCGHVLPESEDRAAALGAADADAGARGRAQRHERRCRGAAALRALQLEVGRPSNRRRRGAGQRMGSCARRQPRRDAARQASCAR